MNKNNKSIKLMITSLLIYLNNYFALNTFFNAYGPDSGITYKGTDILAFFRIIDFIASIVFFCGLVFFIIEFVYNVINWFKN